jgi:hypothetical protein
MFGLDEKNDTGAQLEHGIQRDVKLILPFFLRIMRNTATATHTRAKKTGIAMAGPKTVARDLLDALLASLGALFASKSAGHEQH